MMEEMIRIVDENGELITMAESIEIDGEMVSKSLPIKQIGIGLGVVAAGYLAVKYGPKLVRSVKGKIDAFRSKEIEEDYVTAEAREIFEAEEVIDND